MGKGLYREEFEKDACGIGFIAQVKNVASHKIVEDSLAMLHRMEHRGGVAADGKTGDGAGILIKIPHSYFDRIATESGIELPEEGSYGVAMTFMSKRDQRDFFGTILLESAKELDLQCIWKRKVQTNANELG